MLYELAHYLQNHFTFVWSMIEGVNSALFSIRFGGKSRKIIPLVLADYQDVYEMELKDVRELVSFFDKQPNKAFEFFSPHGFDEKTLKKLVRNPSFLMFIVRSDSGIVGYFFIRSFFMGKSYLGKMVDNQNQGRGIGQKICCCAMDIASSIGLRMYETISKDNLASLYSTQKVLEIEVIKEMGHNYIYIEDKKKK